MLRTSERVFEVALLLTDEDDGVRAHAAGALGRLGEEGAVPAAGLF